MYIEEMQKYLVKQQYGEKGFDLAANLTLKLPGGGGQMALPLGIFAMVHIWRKKCGTWNVYKFRL